MMAWHEGWRPVWDAARMQHCAIATSTARERTPHWDSVRAHSILAAGSDALGCRTRTVAPRVSLHTIRAVYLCLMIGTSVVIHSLDVLEL